MFRRMGEEELRSFAQVPGAQGVAASACSHAHNTELEMHLRHGLLVG